MPLLDPFSGANESGSRGRIRREPLPPLPLLEREWRALEAISTASFFTSWRWIGALLATVPAARHPSLLRGVVQGETVALALLGAAATRRRHGLIQTRSLHLNEVGEPSFDALTIEHNGILAGAAPEPEVYYCGTCLVRRYEPRG